MAVFLPKTMCFCGTSVYCHYSYGCNTIGTVSPTPAHIRDLEFDYTLWHTHTHTHTHIYIQNHVWMLARTHTNKVALFGLRQLEMGASWNCQLQTTFAVPSIPPFLLLAALPPPPPLPPSLPPPLPPFLLSADEDAVTTSGFVQRKKKVYLSAPKIAKVIKRIYPHVR